MKEEIQQGAPQTKLRTWAKWGIGIFFGGTLVMAFYGLCLGLASFLAPRMVIGLPWMVSWYIVEIIVGILIMLHFVLYTYLCFEDSEFEFGGKEALGILLFIGCLVVLVCGITALTEKNIAGYSSVAFVLICFSMVADILVMMNDANS